MKKKKNIIAFGLIASSLFSLFYFLYFIRQASAFESSSTSFEIHAGDMESITGTSTSATFGLHNAGGQNATGPSTATTMSISSGILYWFHSLFTAQYSQMHYRWRNDDGTEANATFSINQDTSYNQIPKNTVKRLRLEISNEGWTRGTAPTLTLEVAQAEPCSSGTYTAVPTDYSGHWHIATSTQFVDEDVTTNVASGLTDENSNFVAGRIKDTSNTTSAITITSSDFTEVEFAVMALNAAVDGANYCFRLTNNGAVSGAGYVFAYPQYAEAIIASGLPATGILDSAVFDTFDGGGATKGPAYNSIMWKGDKNGSSGKVQFQFATSDCANGLDYSSGCTTGAGWSFYGSQGGVCNTTNYYDTTGADAPVELSCSPSQHNNQRYFRYRVRLCSSNCSASGTASPIVDDVVVNWAP